MCDNNNIFVIKKYISPLLSRNFNKFQINHPSRMHTLKEHFRVAGSKHRGHTRAIFSLHCSRLVRDASCRKCRHVDKASGGDKGSGEGLPAHVDIYLIMAEGPCREVIPPIAHPLAARGPLMGGGKGVRRLNSRHPGTGPGTLLW